MKTLSPIKTALFTASLLISISLAPRLDAQSFSFATIAGGTQGSMNGSNAAAQFYAPAGVAVDSNGNVYVADQKNNLIRKITPAGTNWIVSTIAGGSPGSLDGTNTSAEFSSPTGIAVDSSGNLYVADQFNYTIRKITPSGTNWIVSTIAGQAGVLGARNGTYTNAQFYNPTSVALDNGGNIFVADEFNNAIRKITPAGTNWVVSTIAGGTNGASDGTNTGAQFSYPSGVAVDTNGRIFVADQFNNSIRLITPTGTNWVVTTIAGQTIAGFSNGLGTNALFYAPVSLSVDSNENVYVADSFNEAIRELVPSGTNWQVVTLGGGSQGTNNGTGTNARFNLPLAVTADSYGDIFVADSQNDAIRMGLSTNSPAPTGSLEVTISPSNAVYSGAEWQLDGNPTFQTNGAILSGIAPGNHVIAFSAVTGYETPVAQTVSVTARQTILATANYAAIPVNSGSLQVTISPLGAVEGGAQWQVDGGSPQNSGATVTNLAIGNHTLSFAPVFEWDKPVNQIIAVTNGIITSAVGIYTPFAASSDGIVLLTNGHGTIRHGAWPATLVIGKKYTVSAVPAPGNVLSNWIGGTNLPYSLQQSSASYTFVMQSNLVLEANFVTNFFLAAQGTYAGLFAPTNSTREQNASGSFSFGVTSVGIVAGKLLLGGHVVPLSGKFNLAGSANIVSIQPHGEPSITTSLQLDFTNQSVTGTVSNETFISALDGDCAVFNKAHNATEFEGNYTLIIPGTNDPAIGPFGNSYATVKVSSTGLITLAGSLADGTAISQSSQVSKDGYWPLYVSLYDGKGSLWGWTYFTNHTLTSAPLLSWINETNSIVTAMYRAGFTNQQATLAGALYVPVSELPADFGATLIGGNLPSAITITNLSANTNGLAFKLNKATGVISGSFANPSAPAKLVKINGVLLSGTNAAGYFPGTTQSGAFTLESN